MLKEELKEQRNQWRKSQVGDGRGSIREFVDFMKEF